VPKTPTHQQHAALKPAANVREAPHIQLGPTSRSFEWVKWAIMGLCAFGLAAMGYYVLPHLRR